jgi:hypothetical protein
MIVGVVVYSSIWKKEMRNGVCGVIRNVFCIIGHSCQCKATYLLSIMPDSHLGSVVLLSFLESSVSCLVGWEFDFWELALAVLIFGDEG